VRLVNHSGNCYSDICVWVPWNFHSQFIFCCSLSLNIIVSMSCFLFCWHFVYSLSIMTVEEVDEMKLSIADSVTCFESFSCLKFYPNTCNNSLSPCIQNSKCFLLEWSNLTYTLLLTQCYFGVFFYVCVFS
jgi:hypothetical protein